MKHLHLKISTLLFVFALSFNTLSAQIDHQSGLPNFNHTAGYINSMNVVSFKIIDTSDSTWSFVDNSCNTNFLYTTHFKDHSWVGNPNPSTTAKSNWVSLPGGNGPQSFTAEIVYKIQASAINDISRDQPQGWDLIVDGQVCTECIIDVTLGPYYLCGGNWINTVEVTHPYGDSWDTDGIRTFALRPQMTGAAYKCEEDFWGDPLGWTSEYFQYADQIPEIRFNAVMVATSTTDSLGVLTTPLMPVSIIRDPPGDKSYGFIGESTSQCFGTTLRTGTTEDQTSWKEVRLGVAGEVNLGLVGAVNFEIYGQEGTSAGYSYAGNYNQDLQTCFTSTSETTTPQIGAPNDVYLFSSTEYVYGYQKTVHREVCEVVAREGLIFVPRGSNSVIYTESALLTQHLPAAEQLVASLTPGTPEYENAVQQVSVFNQTLAMNAAIKAEAVYIDSLGFSPGVPSHITETIASTISKEITTSVHLSSGLSEEYSSGMGGSSVSQGESINLGTTYGQGQNSTLTAESSVGYHLEDDDTENDDVIVVRFLKDHVFGTHVFELGASSRTSCPYEGGYQIEQPQLWVGSENNSSMEVNPDIGGVAVFPIIVCNNSDQAVSYELALNANTNPNGALISGYNGLTGNNAVPLENIPPHSCSDGFVFLSQPADQILNFEDVEIRLRSDCGNPLLSTSSSIFLTSRFGATNCSVFDTAPTDLTKSFDPVNGLMDRVQVKWFKDSPEVKYSDEDAAACDIKFWAKRDLDPITGNPVGPAINNPDTILISNAKKSYSAGQGGGPREIFKWPVKFRADGANNTKRADPNIRYEWQVRCACEHGAGQESPWSEVKIFNTPNFDTASGIYTPPPGSPIEQGEYKSITANADLKIYPNPASGNEVNLVLTGLDNVEDMAILSLRDVTGKLVFSGSYAVKGDSMNELIRFNDRLGEGLYMLTIEIGNTVYHDRMMVN